MAEFEGNLNLNVETSEIEIKGKFKLTEEELDTVAGGAPSWLDYPRVGLNDSCDDWVRNTISIAMSGGSEVPRICRNCTYMKTLENYHFCTK